MPLLCRPGYRSIVEVLSDVVDKSLLVPTSVQNSYGTRSLTVVARLLSGRIYFAMATFECDPAASNAVHELEANSGNASGSPSSAENVTARMFASTVEITGTQWRIFCICCETSRIDCDDVQAASAHRICQPLSLAVPNHNDDRHSI